MTRGQQAEQKYVDLKRKLEGRAESYDANPTTEILQNYITFRSKKPSHVAKLKCQEW